MQNAHLRLGLLEYQRMTEKISTRIRVRVDRYMGEDRQAHLLSVFGNDADVGAITAAVHEKATFTLTFPDSTTREISLGERASCYKGAVTLSDWRHPVRHLLAVSEELHTNGGVGRTMLLRYRQDEAWASLVSFLGLLGAPSARRDGRERTNQGAGWHRLPTRASIGDHRGGAGVDREGLRSQALSFPEKSGPVVWPQFSLGDLLHATVCTLSSESGSACDV